MPAPKRKAAFIEPMLLLRAETLPEGHAWQYELKLDGYRALAIKTGGSIQLRSRNDNDFSLRYPAIAKALESLPNETVVDGEVVALDPGGKPSFNLLQHHAASADLHLFVFDVLILAGRDVMGEPLTKRRELMERHIFPTLADPYGSHRRWTRGSATWCTRSRRRASKDWWRNAGTVGTSRGSDRARG